MKKAAAYSLALFCLLPMVGLAQAQSPPGAIETPPMKFLSGDCYTGLRDARRSQNLADMTHLLEAESNVGCLVNAIGLDAQARASGKASGASKVTLAGLTSFLAQVADKQSGGSVGTTGSTSAISKNLASSFLSLADNYGALTSTTSGQTTTISGSLDQIPIAIEEQNSDLPNCAVNLKPKGHCIPSGWMTFLSIVSYQASFDKPSASSTTGTASGTAVSGAQQVTGTQSATSLALSQFTGKFLLFHSTPAVSDITLPTLTTGNANIFRLDLLCLERGQPTDSNANGCFTSDRTSEWTTALHAAAVALLAAPRDKVVEELKKQSAALVDALAAHGVTPNVVYQTAQQYAQASVIGNGQERSAWDTAIWKKPILTLEYDYNTPANQPTNSTFRLIYGQSIAGWKLTVNGAGSIYNSQPSSSIPNAGRLRDWQAGAEFDRNLPKLGFLDSSTFSLDAYFQDQTSPAILNVTPGSPVSGVTFTGLSSSASQIYGQTGLIGLGQIKITLANSKGFSFPVTVSGANQTELLTNTKPLFGAQVGISYDLDSALGK